MNKFLEKNAVLLNDVSGVQAIDVEMSRQMDDIERTMETQQGRIAELAAAIKKSGKVLLLGMGASHLVNEAFAFQIRKAGVDAIAMTASEFLYNPIPVRGKTLIFTSQSGESVETVKCLPMAKDAADVFSVTLEGESTIAQSTKAIVCHGGGEKAYAGTRSVTLTMAVFALVSAELGLVTRDVIRQALQFEIADYEALDRAVWLLWSKRTIIVTGRSLFSPLGALFALGSEELGNKVVLFNETGTLRHGPMEVLDSDTVVVVFRQSGELGELVKSFNDAQQKSGCFLIVFDASGLEPLPNAVTIPCAAGADICAVLGMMTTFQLTMIAYACGKNPRAGLPRYSGKITRSE